MQYIQFQPQIASEVPNAAAGTLNYFVDASDNLILGKDENGLYYGYLNSVTVTKAEIDTLITNSGLVPGGFYKITNVNTGLYGGTDIILQAASNNTLERRGVGYFYNPSYADAGVWDYADRVNISSTTGFFNFGENIVGDQGQTGELISVPGTSTLTFRNLSGNWALTTNITGVDSGAVATMTSYISAAQYGIGDTAIWGGTVWVNLTGEVGTSNGGPLYQLDNVNWSGVTYNTSDYNLVLDTIEYDYLNDTIIYRADKTNQVFADYRTFQDSWGFNQIGNFPWGHPKVFHVTVDNSYISNLINFPNGTGQSLRYVNVTDLSSFDVTNWGLHTTITYLNITKASTVTQIVLGDKSNIVNLEIGHASSISYLYLSNNDSGSLQLSNVRLDVAATINTFYVYAGSNMYTLDIGPNGNLTNIYMYGNSSLYAVKIEPNGTLGYSVFAPGVSIHNLNIGINSSIQGIVADADVDISNITLGSNSLINQIVLKSQSLFNNITMGDACNLINITLSGATSSSIFQYVNMGSSSSIDTIDLGDSCQFSRIQLSTNSSIAGLIGNNGITFQNIQLGVGSQIASTTMNDNSTITNFDIGVNSFINELVMNTGITFDGLDVGVNFVIGDPTPVSSNISDIYVNQSGSNWPVSINITGLNYLELSGYTFAGKITLTSSNSTESINQIRHSRPGFTQTLQPQSGLTLTIANTAVNSLASNWQILGTMSNFAVVGTTKGYFVFTTVNNGSFIYVKQVGGDNYI